tara:strand:+ start:151 stop:384 length:234 start_codon:yes stop_codon:yes gene_type:complete
MKWTTREGKTLNVKDMDDNHARNTINMLIKNHSPQVILECILRGEILEQKPLGDMAEEFNTLYCKYSKDINWYKEGF